MAATDPTPRTINYLRDDPRGLLLLLNIPFSPSSSVHVTLDGVSRALSPRSSEDDWICIPILARKGGAPEFHLFSLDASSSPSSSAPPTGIVSAAPFFFRGVSPAKCLPPVVVLRYDPETEEIVDVTEPDGPSFHGLASSISSVLSTGVGDPRVVSRIVSHESFVSIEGGDTGDNCWSACSRHVLPETIGKILLPDGGSGPVATVPSESFRDGGHKEGFRRRSPSYPPVPLGLATAARGHGGPRPKILSHSGTRRYLSSLTPSERTAAALGPGATSVAVLRDNVLRGDTGFLLGSMQLSLLLFVQLRDEGSLSYWRDTVALCGNVAAELARYDSGDGGKGSEETHWGDATWLGGLKWAELFQDVVETITAQMRMFVNLDFFEDLDYSGGNFLIPALTNLCAGCRQCGDTILNYKLDQLDALLNDRFQVKLTETCCEKPKPGNERGGEANIDTDVEMELRVNGNRMLQSNVPKLLPLPKIYANIDDGADGPSSDLEDSPVVVPYHEIESSAARLPTVEISSGATQPGFVLEDVQRRFPLLYASVAPVEDIVMACARILEEASDVSAVREAAAYLQDIESKTGQDG